jgi:hypothetical protein
MTNNEKQLCLSRVILVDGAYQLLCFSVGGLAKPHTKASMQPASYPVKRACENILPLRDPAPYHVKISCSLPCKEILQLTM